MRACRTIPYTAGTNSHSCTTTIIAAAAAAGDSPELLLDVDAAGLGSALQWLSKYKLRRKLQLQEVSQQYSVWTAFDGQLQAGGAGKAAAAYICLQLKRHGSIQQDCVKTDVG
jgi:folate-binding Fe-S cluster repair protein YgfZ